MINHENEIGAAPDAEKPALCNPFPNILASEAFRKEVSLEQRNSAAEFEGYPVSRERIAEIVRKATAFA